MAFFDPVDPSTESSLWPVRVGFCIVAGPAARSLVLLRYSEDPEQKPPVGVAGYVETAGPS